MFEEVITNEVPKILNRLQPYLSDFYLAGGTGLALQMGHRKSLDLDFFTPHDFDTEELRAKIKPDKVILNRKNTIHCEISGIKCSFIYYATPLIYEPISWLKIKIADWRDIVVEKMKTISERF